MLVEWLLAQHPVAIHSPHSPIDRNSGASIANDRSPMHQRVWTIPRTSGVARFLSMPYLTHRKKRTPLPRIRIAWRSSRYRTHTSGLPDTSRRDAVKRVLRSQLLRVDLRILELQRAAVHDHTRGTPHGCATLPVGDFQLARTRHQPLVSRTPQCIALENASVDHPLVSSLRNWCSRDSEETGYSGYRIDAR